MATSPIKNGFHQMFDVLLEDTTGHINCFWRAPESPAKTQIRSRMIQHMIGPKHVKMAETTMIPVIFSRNVQSRPYGNRILYSSVGCILGETLTLAYSITGS